MSIQFVSAPNSLISLGLGVGDVASIVSLGRRMGNWWTASAGDQELLSNLDEDVHNIFHRRGLIDLLASNKRWRKQIRLLANGEPICLTESEVTKVLGDATKVIHELPLFTAIMVCLVAVLDSFSRQDIVDRLLQSVVNHLLQTHPSKEAILRSQIKIQLSAWRSTACLRGMYECVSKIRLVLATDGVIQRGHFQALETTRIESFLVWLLGTNETCFQTPSSDVMGIAFCLKNLGIDIIDVDGPGYPKPKLEVCSVVYSSDIFVDPMCCYNKLDDILRHHTLSTVPLQQPWESVSVFPVDSTTQDRSRRAWQAGKQAAKAIQVAVCCAESESHIERGGPDGTHTFTQKPKDMVYVLVNKGSDVGRMPSELSALAEHYGFVLNQELFDGVDSVLEDMPPDLLAWLDATARHGKTSQRESVYVDMTHKDADIHISAFCVFQSFFMGYYYEVFGNIVDTSTLSLQTVEGTWGFRSINFLRFIRYCGIHAKDWVAGHSNELSRQEVLEILARLYLGIETIPGNRKWNLEPNACIGIVEKRTLLRNSLLGKCAAPGQIGGFTLLDVDVGNIPRDHNGLICPGGSASTEWDDILEIPGMPVQNLQERSPDEDVTFDIEPDWEGDPSTVMLCARYKGRRIATVSPAATDAHFCLAYVPPERSLEMTLAHRPRLEAGVPCELSDLLSEGSAILCPCELDIPTLIQALDRPCFRYILAAMFSQKAGCVLCVVTDSVQRAAQKAQESLHDLSPPPILIGGMNQVREEDFPLIVGSGAARKEVYRIYNHL